MTDWDDSDDGKDIRRPRPVGDAHFPVQKAPPILIISAPSGGGKSTQIRTLIQNNPNCEFLVSSTTRMPRPEEKDKRDYNFLVLKYLPDPEHPFNATPEQIEAATQKAIAEFEQMETEGKLLFETTSFNGHRYGTPRAQLQAGLAAGKQMIADVNLDGLKEFRRIYGDKVQAIFLETSVEELRQRLITRDITPYEKDLPPHKRQTIEETIEQRMALAEMILSEGHAKIGNRPAYDRVISTGTVAETSERVQSALHSLIAMSPTSEINAIQRQHDQAAAQGWQMG